MQMLHSLTSCRTLIDANVVTIWPKPIIQDFFSLFQRPVQCNLLGISSLKNIANVSTGKNECMTMRNGETILVDNRKF